MDVNPSIVVLSASNTKPKSLIKLITGAGCIEDHSPHRATLPWKLRTKYYRASVDVHGITEHYERTKEFNESVEALIIHADTKKENGLDDLEKFQQIQKDCNAEIKLLLVNYCTEDTKVSKTTATEWCLKHGFELIELYPLANNTDKVADEDEVIKEKLGVDRVIEALLTHVWPNLEMESTKRGADDTSEQSASGVNGGKSNCDFLGTVMDDDLNEFTELFSKLHMMKESIQSLPPRERKQCAEQMVTAFWGAIGGDEEEIANLD